MDSTYGASLWIVLMVYAIIRTVLAWKLREWLDHNPGTDEELEMYSKERSNNLTLAGFALAAIALFLTIDFSSLGITLNNIKETVLYLSISLVLFVLGAYLYNFSTKRAFTYVAGTLEWLGLLSVGISLLIFFGSLFKDDLRFFIVYIIFFGAIWILAFIEVGFYNKFLKSLKKPGTL